MNPRVDACIREIQTWREEAEKLRVIALGCGPTEELKRGEPCYTFNEGNVAIIQGFKEYSALIFCKGALLRDPKGALWKIGEHTQAARQIRFTDAREIVGMEPVLKACFHEAIEAEKAGLRVKSKRNPEPVPVELQIKLGEIPALKAAFGALTPGRQRAYILYVSAAKQSKTRESRVGKCMRRILSGKGLDD